MRDYTRGLSLLCAVGCLFETPAAASITPTIPPTSTQAQPVPHDHTPPTGTIVINAGATWTSTSSVTLSLSATDNSGTVANMRFSNDGVTYSTPEPYATTKSWSLASGDGSKTVSVQFADAAGNWSQPASDTIILDMTPPVVQITDPTDGQVFGAQ